jgi:hypothetical protein
MTAPNVVPLRPESAADRLERLARRPLQPRREELLEVAGSLRALEAFTVAGREQLSLDLEAVA